MGLNFTSVAVGTLAAIVISALVGIFALEKVHGLDLDVLHGARSLVSVPEIKSSPVVVIAIDEKTHLTPPFWGLPKVMWTPHIAAVQNSVIAGGAAVFGWDVILPTSASAYVSDRQFDGPLLRSLAMGAKSGKIILGNVQVGSTVIGPHRAFSWAVKGDVNIRSLNVVVDDGGVVRRVPLFQTFKLKSGGTTSVPTMAMELASRARGVVPVSGSDGQIVFDGSILRGVNDGILTLGFNDYGGQVPTYSLADLFECSKGQNAGFFKKQFAGKIVLLGQVLDIEDRKVTSNRFMKVRENPSNYRSCGAPGAIAELAQFKISSGTPGVYIHAAAVANILDGGGLGRPEKIAELLIVLALAIVSAALVITTSASVSVFVVLLIAIIWSGASIQLVHDGTVLPYIGGMISIIGTAAFLLVYRYMVSDRDKRFLSKAFASYISPNLVAELAKSPDKLILGGERKEMTFLFTDLEGFTSLVEQQDSEIVVPLLNQYLDDLISITFRHGGTIDKIVGDAVVVMFSAPVHQPDHAARAIACALEMDAFCQGLVARKNKEGIPLGITRIGVNTGYALVGNFGGSALFDYTAHGDAINTAARLESINKQLGTRVCISGTTVSQCDGFIGRPVGKLILKGKTRSVEAFQPLSEVAGKTPAQIAYLKAYQLMEAVDRGAREAFADVLALDPDDKLAAFHLARLERGESGVTILFDSK